MKSQVFFGYSSASSGTTVTPTVAALTLTTFAPTVSLTVTPSAASLTLSSFAPVVQVQVTPSAAALVLTAYAPTVRVGGGGAVFRSVVFESRILHAGGVP